MAGNGTRILTDEVLIESELPAQVGGGGRERGAEATDAMATTTSWMMTRLPNAKSAS